MTNRLKGKELLELRDSMLHKGALQTEIMRASGYCQDNPDGTHKYDMTSYAFELAVARGLKRHPVTYSVETIASKE